MLKEILNEWGSLVTGVTAAVSLIISIIALMSSHRNSVRMLKIEEERDRAARLEQGKARVTARIERSGNVHFLIVRNDGPGTASNITILLDGKPAADHPSMSSGETGMDRLTNGAEARAKLNSHLNLRLPKLVEITWIDASGEKGEYLSNL